MYAIMFYNRCLIVILSIMTKTRHQSGVPNRLVFLNKLSTNFAIKPELKYPFKRGWHPQSDQPFEVADGVFWLYMPMPMSLDHINLWLLKDGDGWVIVDSGLDAPSCKAVWDKLFDTFLTPKSVNYIYLTHFHPDHIGLAAWLGHKCDCKIKITAGEFNHYHSIISRKNEQHKAELDDFIQELGFKEEQAANYKKFSTIDPKSPKDRVQQENCEFISEHDRLTIGDHTWRVVMGSGHSPEHACLYCPELKTMISGDQALPRISSNISVYLINRDENPLLNWLDSCAKLRDEIPVDTLILPSHQEPFYGIDLRMQQLIDDHIAQLNKLRLKAIEPITTNQARRILFDRELSSFETMMATSEALAHINYLLHNGELSKSVSDDQSMQYQMSELIA